MNAKITIWSTLAIALAATFMLFGTSYAGDSGSPISFSGTVNGNNQLVDNNGRTFNIANSGEGREVQSLIGKKVAVKGTVLESMGKPTIEVHDYTIKWFDTFPMGDH